MLLVFGIGDRLRELFVTADAAAIRGRAGTGAGDAARICHASLGGDDRLDRHAMAPAVTEVVLEVETVAGARRDFVERPIALAEHPA